MHRFESVQHLPRHMDGRQEYFNSSHLGAANVPLNQGFGGRGNMSLSGKGNPHNPRMSGMFGAGSSSIDGGNPSCPSSSMYNNYRNNMPYHQSGSGMMMEGMGYLAQKRNSQMMASGQATAEGYGIGGGASRFHPYQSQIQHQPPHHPQPQRSGFLEQLLKNRGSNPQPYGRSLTGMPPSTLNSYPGGPQSFRGNSAQPGWNNYYQGMNYGPGVGGGRTPFPHFQPTQWGRGTIGGGAFQPYVPHLNSRGNFNSYPNYQSNYSNLHQNSPFNHSHLHQQQQLPVIKNEPEDESSAQGNIEDH